MPPKGKNKNKLYTLSYTRKKLSEKGINVIETIKYDDDDSDRYWCMLTKSGALIVCFKTEEDYWFTFSNGINVNKIVTKSTDVLSDTINGFENA